MSNTVTIERSALGVIPDALADCHDLANLWSYYKAFGDSAARERLILFYAPLVTRVARRIRSGLPATNDLGDLIGDGMFGLFDAIEKFDPALGIKFETYAQRRVRGAIFDQLRNLDWLPRRARDEIKAVDKATRALETNLQHTPTAAEVAEVTGLTCEQVRDAGRPVTVLSLDVEAAPYAVEGGRWTLADTLADHAPGPDDELGRELREAVRQLPKQDRIVISLHYFDGLTLTEIARILGLTESRVCQIARRARGSLRSALSPAA